MNIDSVMILIAFIGCRIRQQKTDHEEMNFLKHKQLLFYCILLMLTSLVLLFFSTSTSPLYPNNYGYDSAYYRFIGASMLKGKTPYKDIWDNKGPVLYFIQALGALHGTRNEKISVIFLLQILSAFTSVFILDQTDRLFRRSRYRQIRFALFFFLSALVFCSFLMDGNLTEEWSVPMICFSLYLFARYALRAEKDPSHPRLYAFLHGICFALIAFIRINNTVTILAGAACIGIYLIRKKQRKNLAENFCFGILGISAITLPIFVFFISKHALGDMLYANFIYNFTYAANRAHKSAANWSSVMNLYSPIIASGLLILICTIRHKKFLMIDFISAAVVLANAVMLLRINTYSHYFIVYVPVFLFVLIRYCDLTNIPAALITAVLLAWFFRQELNMFLYLRNSVQPDLFATVSTYLPKDERDSVIAIDVPPGIYLNTNITPVSRFAAFQRDFLKYGKGFEEEFILTLQEKEPKWIITPYGHDNLLPFVKNLLDERYEYKFSDSACSYNRLIEP